MNLRGFLLALAAVLSSADAMAAEVKVLASNSVRTMLEDIAPLFTRASSHTVTLGFGTSAQVAKRVTAGEAVDLLVVTPDVVEQLSKTGKLAGAATSVARSLMGVGVRTGTPHPDISTADALRKTLLAVKAVTFSDPATGAASGVHTVKIFERLGIADAMKPKIKIAQGGRGAMELLAKGEVDIGLTFISEIITEPGVEVVGPLPRDISARTELVAFVAAHAKDPAAAKALVAYLSGPEAAKVYVERGMQPGR